MKVQLERSFPMPASADTTWALLQDIEAVAGCMPGARITEHIDATHYKGTVSIKLGPANLSFRGEIEVRGLDAAARSLQLFAKGTEEAGRLIGADHTSVMRLSPSDESLRVFAAWSRDTSSESYAEPVFRLGFGVAGRVASDRRASMVNETEDNPDFVQRKNPVARLLCVPLTYYEHDRQEPVVFGVLNATRRPGAARFTEDDLEYLTRFAGQLAIAVANSMAFAAERERSEQLALVNAFLREMSGTLSRERILETAVKRIQEAFHYPVVAISVSDSQAGTYRITAIALRTPLPDDRRTFPMHAGITGRAYRDKRTVHVLDVREDPDYIALVPSSGSEVAIPIFSGDEVAAVLNVEKDEPGGFDHGQVITLETLADGIGVVLRNAELYQALETTNAKLVELDRMKSELVNIVAHDFRAPLAGVLGHAELLEWRPDAPREERIEEARSIIHAATHMASLVDKTLETTRLESGRMPFDFAVFDLAALTRDVVGRAVADPARERPGVVIQAELPGGTRGPLGTQPDHPFAVDHLPSQLGRDAHREDRPSCRVRRRRRCLRPDAARRPR